MTIVSDACTINVSLALALALASVVNYGCKGRHNLERHLLTTLESSFTIVKCLLYRPVVSDASLKSGFVTGDTNWTIS